MTSNAKDLREYLRNVLDIESSLYVLQKFSEELYCKLNGLGALKAPEKPSVPEAPKLEDVKGGRLGAAVVTIFGIAGLILTYVTCRNQRSDFYKLVFAIFLGLPSITLMLGGFASGFGDSKKNQEATQRYEVEKDKYRSQLAEYQNKVIATQKENAKRQAERAVLQANINAAGEQISSSILTLDKLYSANIIHPKYRNFTAVSSLYEYIDTGRCSQLEGPNGAYNMFENEVRLDHILLKMDDVIEKLDSIRQSQYQLYAAVTEGNRRTASLLESVAQDVKFVSASESEAAKQLTGIAASEKVIAYNTERTRKELEYYNRMRYRLGDYDKVWDNKRP